MNYNYKVPPCSRKELRKFARRLKRKLGIEKEICCPIVELFEALASEGFFNFEIVEEAEMPSAYAETLYRDKVIRLREDIYDMAVANIPFGRSTIAHELLHFFKHRNEEVVFLRSVDDIKSRRTYEDPEWQANCFAGELLVPKELVQGMTVEEVMDKCKVSREMATIQLRHYEEESWNNEKSL